MYDITSSDSNKLDHSSFGLISQVYQSDLKLDMKNDCACAILARRYHLNVVSILLYDGHSDRLINRGSFVNQSSFEYIGNDGLRAAKTHMLEYILFYDFLYYRFYHEGIPSILDDDFLSKLLDEFKSSKNRHFHYVFDNLDLLDVEFARICFENAILLGTNGQININSNSYAIDYNNFFYLYKRQFPRNEEYIIGPNERNYSGRIFWSMLDGQKKIPDARHPFVYANEIFNEDGTPYTIPNSRKKFLIALEQQFHFKFKFDDDNTDYWGLPLWANGRPLGVVRILIDKVHSENFKKDRDRIKSLRHATEMLANFLDQNYAQEFIDSIEHKWADEGTDEREKADEYCSSMRKAMDSFGCILRLSASIGEKVMIVGKSTDNEAFGKLISETLEEKGYDGFIIDGKFNPCLTKCFLSTHSEDILVDDKYRLVGIAVVLDNTDDNQRYFYRNTGEERIRETDDLFIFKNREKPELKSIFHPSSIEALTNIPIESQGTSKNISIKYVLIMDIPALDVDGILTFANTINRPFNLADARFAYGELKRLGLEKSKVNKERLKNYKLISDTYFHDIKNIIHVSISQTIELNRSFAKIEALISKLGRHQHDEYEMDDLIEIVDESKEENKNVRITSQLAFSKIKNFQNYTEIITSLDKIQKLQNDKWNLREELKRLCQLFSFFGNKFKHTGVYFDIQEACDASKVFLNKLIIDFCISNLLDNAIKYSWSLENKLENSLQLDDYDPNNILTKGHVHVLLSENDSDYFIEVISWGCLINNSLKIFEKGYRSGEAEKFCIENNPAVEISDNNISLWTTGRGIGLHSVRTYIQKIGGNCFCKVSGAKATFTLVINK